MASAVRAEADHRIVGNLPLELTSFVGRRRELADARRLFESSRLLTLTGVGGVGKTRLAIRLAGALQRVFSGGTWLVELGELSDPDLLEDHVALTLGVRPVSSSDSLHAVIDYCADRSLLLVLDNCEHLVDSVARLCGAILRRCAGVKILATSRESLGMGGEVTMRVPSLTTPALRGPNGSTGLAQYESVLLFTERAAAVVPGFALTEENRHTVARICQDLDGLPLPIELAAARLRGMSAEQIMNRLSDRYRLLTNGGRDVPSRQQTLRLSIDWSYDLCSLPEQRLWGRLSVFSGGFDLDAAEGVCGQDSSSTETLDLVTGLVEKSILIREEIDGSVRYHLLDLLREYGREKLDSTGEQLDLPRRHRDWFEGLVIRAESDWISSGQASWAARLGREQHNLYDALEYSISTVGEARSATRMFAAWYRFLLSDGLIGQLRYWADRTLNAADSEPDMFRVDVLCVDAAAHAMQGDLVRARELIDEGRRLAEALGDVRSRALTEWAGGYVDTCAGELDNATAKLESAVTLFRLDENLQYVVISLDTLGLAYILTGALERSAECFDECLEITEPLREVTYQAHALGFLGLIAWLRGDFARTSEYLTRSLRIDSSSMNAAWCIEPLAWTAVAQRDWKHGAVLLGAAAMYWQKIGQPLTGFSRLSSYRENAMDSSRKALGDSAFDREFHRGIVMTEGEAVAYALDERRSASASLSTEAIRLTRREQQVAELVAQGLTNRAIAEHLVISPRTAQGHVENVLTKLGFTSRAQIAAWVVSTAQEDDSQQIKASEGRS
ncbi:LuxR family transcriptional regulator [Rhodococcus erythropolis]|uniref:ATP-binding protein n=1 Tax=Rhodococcus erythropolis TaxID=1833 RepID=UPI001F28B41F|nr:LuxR C-terminal-related transcriptional regulator [Rhodococcus erythropolis]UJC80296.1 LuxR family transcriptional regulator [Rhodococcus erythropolis]